MHELYKQVLQALQMEDKEQAVKLSMDALENKHVTVMELYESILSPALASIINEYEDEGVHCKGYMYPSRLLVGHHYYKSCSTNRKQ